MYPSPEQETLLAKTFGCCRYVYNRGLAIKTERYQKEKKGLSMFALMADVTKWKSQEETVWLGEVNSQALQMSLRHLDSAYTRFFKKIGGYPKFKSKYDNHQSFCNPQSTTVDFDAGIVYIPKFKNGIKTVFHRQFDGKIKSSTVSKTPSGKYFISILVETDKNPPKRPVPKEDKTLGIDLGIKSFATFSDGTKVENPCHLAKKLKRLKRANRKLSRKQKGSKNRDKQRKKVARLYEKVTNARKDFLHKLSHKLTENQGYGSIAIEDLNVADMMKSGKKNKLSRHIADAGWGMFRTFLTYKCERTGKNLLVIGRFEPSSKLCSCGYLNNNLTLKDREWDCPACKQHHDRDVLAAKNIKRFAFCKQNTSKDKISVGQELPKPAPKKRGKKPLETRVSGSVKKEASILLG